MYPNTTVLQVTSPSKDLSSRLSTTTQDPLNAFILQGLGTHTSEPVESLGSAQPGNTTSAAKPISSTSSSSRAANASYYSASTTSNYPLYNNVFTATPRVSTAAQAMSQAMQCWSEIATWRNSSALFWNAKIADRTWAITSSWSSLSMNWTRTSTIYPSSVSTYTLCDGTPRADVRPRTTTISGTSTLSASITATLTPTFAAQPCSLEPRDCRILYQDTNIEAIDDRELLRQCGNPAHVVGDAECLVGGGPVEIIYFPVTRNDTKLCQSSNSTVSAGPLIPRMSEISTLGHSFTSASAYISFKTLYATYDGFWDTVGPTFTDYIVPLLSADISTQCGGWGAAYGHGTALNYADLNWPVPASAYKCQDRCAVKLASSGYIANGAFMWSLYDEPVAPECSTIWSDINPVLALPTKIKDMVPEWSSCSFYNDNLANFWFDPPIALQPQEAVAKPTLPSSFVPQSISAAPASTPDGPAPQSTQAAPMMTSTNLEPIASTVSAKATVSSTATMESETLASDQPLLFTVVDSSQETTSSSSINEATTRSAGVGSVNSEPPTPDVVTDSSSQDSFLNDASFEFKPIQTQESASAEPAQTQSSVGPEIATAAGFSILTQALSSFKDAGPAPTSSFNAPASSLETELSSPNAPSQSINSGVVVTLPSGKFTAVQTNDHFIVDSTTIASGEVLTISGNEISINSGGLVVGESTFVASALETPTATRTAYVIAPGGFTLSATSIQGNSEAVQVGTAILSVGGPAATVSGQFLTKGTDGVVLLPHGTGTSRGTALPPVVNEQPAQTAVLAAGSHTVTAVIFTGDHTAISVGGTTLSLGGDAAVIQNATFTVGPGGLGVVRSHTSRPGANSTTTLPSVVITSSSTSTRSRWSSSASSTPTTTTSGGSREEQTWARIMLLSGSFVLALLCM